MPRMTIRSCRNGFDLENFFTSSIPRKRKQSYGRLRLWHRELPIICHTSRYRLITLTQFIISSAHLSTVNRHRRGGGAYRACCRWVASPFLLSFEKLRSPKLLILWEQHADYQCQIHWLGYWQIRMKKNRSLCGNCSFPKNAPRWKTRYVGLLC